MRLFDFFGQFDVLTSVRQNNQRKVYIGPGNELIYQIQSNKNKSGDVGIVSKVLFSPKKKPQGQQGDPLDESDDAPEPSGRCCSFLWKKMFNLFFNKTDRMNPLIVENARNVIDRRKDDQKETLDMELCINRIERLESSIVALTRKLQHNY